MFWKRRVGRRLGMLTVLMLVAALAAPATAADIPGLQVPAEAIDAKEATTYIVWMADDPAVAYDGEVAGLAATRPARGEKIDPNANAVRRYQDYLRGRHDAALTAAGAGGSKLYDYTIAFNGFAARLTGRQAAAMLAQPGVIRLFENERLRLDTITTPDFLGLTDSDGAWAQGYVGENVIVGVVDSGFWPENPSFSDRTGTGPNSQDGKLGYQQIPGWHGRCVPGEAFNAGHCNQKVIGAQYFHAGFGSAAEVKATFPYEFVSPRDADGHGSHTASTSAGNAGVAAGIYGETLGNISGMAPRARIAVYKACWGYSDDPAGGCFSVDTVAAIDQAVADGVDVINFSISGTQTSFLSAVEVAFLFAADAGVFVAAAAGNTGPGASTVNHPSPWLTTVAAGTHDRTYGATLRLGNGATYTGGSIQGGTPVLDLVYGGAIPASGAAAADAARCFAGTLDPAQAAGKMVICDRGVSFLVDKSAEVFRAGGAAMVLVNVVPGSVLTITHSVPSIHVDDVAGAAIKAYAATLNPTGQLDPAVQGFDPAAPQVAGFSSRGPSLATGDLLKPDIMAPGVDVLAAYSPVRQGRNFDMISGTSMSSPHIAGLAAVVAQAHPSWTPEMIKSALMTTSNDTAASPFDEGSGHVNPNSALDPGLVYEAGFLDYFGFLCGTGQLVSASCAALAIDPSDLNQPNISIGDLAGSQTVTRTVTNVGPAGTYQVSISAPAGIDVTVSPTSLNLASGASASYEVTLTRNGAALDAYTFGNLTWSDGVHSVRSVLAVQPVQLAAPGEVTGTGTTGSVDFSVGFGYDGPFTPSAHGLMAPTRTAGNVVDDPADDINTALATGIGVTFHFVNVPAGTMLTRFSLFDDFTDGADDLDMYVFDPGFAFVGGSGNATSDEQVELLFPAAGAYLVVVHGFETDGPDSNYTLFDWSVSATPGGDMTVSDPGDAVLGTSATITASWSNLASDERYLGVVTYDDGGGLIGLTRVVVNTE